MENKEMNRIKYLTILLFGISRFVMFAQTDKPAYTLYSGQGKVVNYQTMISDLSAADVIFVGEYHNNPISHWLELEITRSLFETKKGKIILGAEMFESDSQLELTEYVTGLSSTTRFETDTRLWSNYKTDYKPLVEFAKANKLPFVATNIPRRYADMVNKRGGEKILDSLSTDAKKRIAPLPIPFKSDSIMLKEMSGARMMMKNTLALAKAQAVKDATMAWFIAQNSKKGKTFIHYNGSFHSDNYGGILYFLKIYSPKLNVKTITTVEQPDVNQLESNNVGRADYVICAPETMTKTY